jgi:hypothetical protein
MTNGVFYSPTYILLYECVLFLDNTWAIWCHPPIFCLPQRVSHYRGPNFCSILKIFLPPHLQTSYLSCIKFCYKWGKTCTENRMIGTVHSLAPVFISFCLFEKIYYFQQLIFFRQLANNQS